MAFYDEDFLQFTDKEKMDLFSATLVFNKTVKKDMSVTDFIRYCVSFTLEKYDIRKIAEV